MFFFNTRQRTLFAECFFLPGVFSLALGKEALCRVPEKNTRQTTRYSAKSRIPVVNYTLQIGLFFGQKNLLPVIFHNIYIFTSPPPNPKKKDTLLKMQ
jgi:hypothetical protein